MSIEEIVRKHLQEGRMMQVATVKDDQPWNCTVYFVPDENLNLYWISLPKTRHSQEIKMHSKVACAIPIKYVPGKEVVGLQAEGEAHEVTDGDEIKNAIRLYTERYQTGEAWYQDFIDGKNPHKLYRIRPRLLVLFDEENFPEDSRKEWRLNEEAENETQR